MALKHPLSLGNNFLILPIACFFGKYSPLMNAFGVLRKITVACLQWKLSEMFPSDSPVVLHQYY